MAKTSMAPDGIDPSMKHRESGMVRVWDKIERRWKWVYYVDAKEMVAVGSADTAGPSIKMKRGTTQIDVCQSEVEEYAAQGYKIVEPEKVPPIPPPPVNKSTKGQVKDSKSDEGEDDGSSDDGDEPGGKDDGGDPPEEYDFTKHTVAQLREMASKAKIDDFEDMNKAQLCEALDESGWRPE